MATADQAAAHVFINRRRFHELVARGVLPIRGDNGWNLDEVRERYIKNIQSVAAGREGADDDEDRLDGEHENARVRKETADKLAMENAVRRGELIPRRDVVEILQKAFVSVRSKLLGLPSKESAIFATMTDARAIFDRMTNSINDLLSELANTRWVSAPEGGDGSGGSPNGSDVGVGSPAPADRKRVGRQVPKAKPGSKRRTRAVEHKPS